MNIVLFEEKSEGFHPLTLTRPVFDMMLGGISLYDLVSRLFKKPYFSVPKHLEAVMEEKYPGRNLKTANLKGEFLFINSHTPPSVKLLREIKRLKKREMLFDSEAQPQASTLSDYLLPGPTEVPSIRILHMETPSPYTRFGAKGIGEGGAIAPPAAITNAINDALKGLGAELAVSPVTPRRIVEAIAKARRDAAA